MAVDAALAAGRVVMDVYATDFAVAYKGHNDPVTEADQRANDVIVRRLTAAFPDDVVVAEESPAPTAPHAAHRVWYVDPLDGTKEFIARNGEFSVMIGLAIDGRAHLGVVYRPDGDVLYAGIVGLGAWMEHHGTRTPLAITPVESVAPLTLAISRSHRHRLLKTIDRDLVVGKKIPLGSVGLKIGLIARGHADVYMELGSATGLWDACGPDAILHAAGGRFTSILGQPIAYGGLPLNNPHGLLATNGSCHERVVRALQPMAGELGLHP